LPVVNFFRQCFCILPAAYEVSRFGLGLEKWWQGLSPGF